MTVTDDERDARPTERIELESTPDAIVARRRRRRVWPWVALAIALVVVAAGVVVGEQVAAATVRDSIRDRIVEAFGLDEDTEVDVALANGPVIPQLLTGRLTTVEVDIPELEIGALGGELRLRAESVPLDAAAPVERVAASFAVDEGELLAIAQQLSGLDPDVVALEEPEIVVSADIALFGFDIPIALGLEPDVRDGAIVFTPTSFRVGDDVYTADELTSIPAFGDLARALLQQRPVCVAELLPAWATVDAALVTDDRLVVTLTAADAVLSDTAPGTCTP